ncbi:DUF2752 domain-containing protein [uncultured Muribaculum sp.]|uniref:DUF2752 domain-containing protein n=2 Tax=uncultured Muribaculum sp. TaxID=1918613 RepID=UPI00266F4FF3|nr:DUF2752 domain-containing protein [uncultured Muribaculum sp.]
MAVDVRHRVIMVCAAAVVFIVAAWLYFSFDPASTHLFPKCLFLQVTGFKCPGCGSQRAVHAILNGDMATAWRMNAFLVAAIPVIAVMLVAELLRTRNAAFYKSVNALFFIRSCFYAFISEMPVFAGYRV